MASASLAPAGGVAPWRSAPGPVPILVTSGNLAADVPPAARFVASWLGRELTVRILGPLDCATGWITGATLGLGLIAACGFVAGTLGVLRPLTLWGVVTLAALGLVVAARKRLMREARGLALWLARPTEGRLCTTRARRCGARLLLLAEFASGRLPPDLGSDAIRQRLATAAHFAQQGQPRADNPDLFVAREPAFGEITYAAIISVSSVQGTKLAHFLIGLLCARSSRSGGSWAARWRVDWVPSRSTPP
ncbi:MAG: hypothetical protein U0232_08170 [Thermomicrobiales bacterium]